MINLTTPLQKKIRWGAAGCGKFTETTFIPTIAILRRTKLIALFSNDIKRAKSLAAKYSIPKYFSSYQEFLNSEIDAVYVGSANAHHFEQVILAAKAGKHVLCDKPISITSQQAEEMVEVCNANNVQFAVNYPYRFHPLIQKAKEIIDNQLLGKISVINTNFNINLFPSENFRYNKNLSGGGALRDLGTHLIDLLRYLGGDISEISGVMENIIFKTDVEDFASGIAKFSKSGYGTFTVSYASPKSSNRIEVIGNKGSIIIDNLIGQKFPSSAKMTISVEGKMTNSFRKRANKFYRLLRSVNKSFLKNESPFVTGLDGLINMKLMEEFESKCLSKKN